MTINAIDVGALMRTSSDRAHFWCRALTVRQCRVVAEVGVWKGDFAARVLREVPCIDAYYMIDPWENLPDWNKPFNVQPDAFRAVYEEMSAKTDFAAHKRRILRGRTKEVVDQIPDGSLDFAYIDGDHTLRGIALDLIKIWPKVKAGGWVGGDDFTTTPWQHGAQYEPTMVFPFSVYFAEAMDVPIVALGRDQFLIVKDAAVGFSFTDLTGRHGDLALNRTRGNGTGGHGTGHG